MTTRTTVAVIGGGPAGASCATALARAGVAVTLVEAGDGGGNPFGESLAPSATPLLHRLGFLDALLATNPLPCHGNRSIWGSEAPEERGFLRDPHGPGWHLDRPAFNAALLATAAAAGADCRCRTRARTVARDAGGWLVALEGSSGPEAVRADLVVDATGRPARIARMLGARPVAFDQLVGVVALLERRGSPFRDSFTLIEARPDGWWYSALLPDGRLAAAFFSDPDLLAARAAWTAEGWAALVGESRETRRRVATAGYALTGRPALAPAGNACLQPAAGDGWLAVGDAAAAYDPLSSHGIGSALAGGQAAADATARHLAGDRAALSGYANRIGAGYARYLKLWLAYYAQERRWTAAPFWQRRQPETGGR